MMRGGLGWPRDALGRGGDGERRDRGALRLRVVAAVSSPSKRRKQARAWMQKAAETFEQRGFREGAARMRDDMMRLLPSATRERYADDGSKTLTHVINQFPNPYESGPYWRVVMPEPPSFRLSPYMGGGIPKRYRTIDFRPVEHAITMRGPDGAAHLRWFTWEPTAGSDDIGERTSALFTGLGKLSRAASYVEFASMRYGSSELAEARDMIRDAADELRRRLGKFAVDGDRRV